MAGADAPGDAVSPKHETRARYRHWETLQTRWMDNDVYGHVNNVVYYSLFDTVVNGFLIARGVLDIERSEVIGLVVETMCQYHAPLVFPDRIDGGVRVGRLGTSSIRYEIGLFRVGDAAPAATGHFIHVTVDRATRRPAPIPPETRAVLNDLLLPDTL
jgi:acyl-CoA thioester hydrolase